MKSLKRSTVALGMIVALAGIAGPVSAQTLAVPVNAVPINAVLPSAAWPGHWAQQDLQHAAMLGITAANRYFAQPELSLPVAGAAEVLTRMAGAVPPTGLDALAFAQEKGWIKASDFGAEQVTAEATVSRELFGVWTARAMGLGMLAENAKILMTPQFADADQIDGRYRNAVAILQEREIIHGAGDSAFAPKRSITAAEALRLLSNVRAVTAVEGTYEAQLPGASGSRKLTLAVGAGGAVTFTHDYMNGKPAIVEVGGWQSDLPGRVTVTLTGREDQAYQQPEVITFEVKGRQLIAKEYDKTRFGTEGLSLTRQMAGAYSAQLPSASSPGRGVTLTLGADQTVNLTTDYMNGKPAIVEVGRWEEGENNALTVTINGQEGRPYNEPNVISFDAVGDMLVAREYDQAIYGSAGLRLYRSGSGTEVTAADQNDTSPKVQIDGEYGAMLRAASSPGRKVTLTLNADQTLRLSTDYLNGEPVIVELGSWVDNGNGTVTATITGRDGLTYRNEVVIVFAATGSGLTAVQYDLSRFGSEGLKLERH